MEDTRAGLIPRSPQRGIQRLIDRILKRFLSTAHFDKAPAKQFSTCISAYSAELHAKRMPLWKQGEGGYQENEQRVHGYRRAIS
ncbi:hypothetical protein CgunFtcFv8_027771 [Champsocephalus gunnari]|uniref:Uncharacterized protein n=1 Tax=Champsocephalus gunnari TaxID=52237 RepID=A0AAN8ECG5_CHAGU|nr:hypothetical protein CgunFtcFv8_004729 [Champsocephalus gunnari]KAK5936160.1 hypothetical protein CgunFtcFv8_027771 [Champsocephalus gunnari]